MLSLFFEKTFRKLLYERVPCRWSRRLVLLNQLVTSTFPRVDYLLSKWREVLSCAGDPELVAQGLASISKKRFHAQGGSIYALAGKDAHVLLPFIVALQTISDYLDNLCDRSGCFDMEAFRQLHNAYIEALDPDRPKSCYYSLYPFQDDGGYLDKLVDECRSVLLQLPSYNIVKRYILRLAGLYSDLQTFKHTVPHLREGLLRDWFGIYAAEYSYLRWWEFAAAAGSTLGIFALCAAAGSGDLQPEDARRIVNSYFPWICGLHILLDYFIDQDEDSQGGDLNFVLYYPDGSTCRERLLFFLSSALGRAAELPDPVFHETVVKGLPAFYLSDPKVEAQGLQEVARSLLTAGGRSSLIMYSTCRLLRRLGKI